VITKTLTPLWYLVSDVQFFFEFLWEVSILMKNNILIPIIFDRPNVIFDHAFACWQGCHRSGEKIPQSWGKAWEFYFKVTQNSNISMHFSAITRGVARQRSRFIVCKTQNEHGGTRPTLENFVSAKFSKLFAVSVIFTFKNIHPSGNFEGKTFF